jgi:hypothetical protein
MSVRAQRPIVVLGCMLGLASCALPGGPAPAEAAVPVDIEVHLEGPRADTDRIVAARDGDLLVIDVFSGTGIGRARIEKPPGGWPPRARFRLHLRALEGFTVTGAHRFEIGGLLSASQGAPIDVDLPAGVATASVSELSVQWVDRYR